MSCMDMIVFMDVCVQVDIVLFQMYSIYIYIVHALVSANPQVKASGGDIGNAVHHSQDMKDYRDMLLNMIHMCAKLWKMDKAPCEFVEA